MQIGWSSLEDIYHKDGRPTEPLKSKGQCRPFVHVVFVHFLLCHLQMGVDKHLKMVKRASQQVVVEHIRKYL